MSSKSPRLVAKDDCGCRHFVDARGHEFVEQCSADKQLSDARHQSAVESCSHVYRDAQVPA